MTSQRSISGHSSLLFRLKLRAKVPLKLLPILNGKRDWGVVVRKCSGFALIVLTVVIGKKGWDSRGNWTNQSCNCKNHKRASIAAAGFWWLFFLLKTLLNAAKQNRILWPTRDDYDFYNISHKSRKISQFYENSNLVLCFSHLIICHFPEVCRKIKTH